MVIKLGTGRGQTKHPVKPRNDHSISTQGQVFSSVPSLDKDISFALFCQISSFEPRKHVQFHFHVQEMWLKKVWSITKFILMNQSI